MPFWNDLTRGVSNIGKKAWGFAKEVGQGIKKYGPQIASIAADTGDFLTKASPYLSAVPEIGPQLSLGAMDVGKALSMGGRAGKRLLTKSDDPLAFAGELYNAIQGKASGVGGMVNGSSDVAGLNTTPQRWNGMHEAHSNAGQKMSRKRTRAGDVRTMPVQPNQAVVQSIANPRPSGGPNLASGPMVNMSSDYLADQVTQAKNLGTNLGQQPAKELSLKDRLQKLWE